MKYLQWLWDKVLEKEAILLEGAEGSQVIGSKHKEVVARDEEVQWPSKKARRKQLEKYHEGATVKIEGSNPCKRCVCIRQDCLVHPLRWVILLYLLLLLLFHNFLYSWSLTYARCIVLKQWYVPHTHTNTLAMIPTYGGVLNTIKKALQELMEEYWGVGKSLCDLVKGQERNTAQLERIRAAIEQRWGSEEKSRKEESENDAEGSEDGPGESQGERTPSSAFY